MNILCTIIFSSTSFFSRSDTSTSSAAIGKALIDVPHQGRNCRDRLEESWPG
jgi:hypothetical protein